MKRMFTLALLLVMLTATFAAPAKAAPEVRSYILIAKSDNSLPANLEAKIARAGGTLTRATPQIGIAVATSSSPKFQAKAAKITGIRAVVPNVVLQWIDDPTTEVGEQIGYPPNSGAGDTRFDLEWGMKAIDAPGAWDLGYFGEGVRVAVLDSGIDRNNPDLSPNLNQELSVSFISGEEYYFQPDLHPEPFFNHGTHVAGTIAAAINDYGVIGVAPEAELVMVKVLSEFTGSGSWEGVIAGIVYAADIQADVINMSLGGTVQRRGFQDGDVWVTAKEVTELVNAMNRATSYAYTHGVTIVASAGNSAMDFDHTADVIDMPAQAINVVTVAATAPIGWALDPENTFLDNPASYTNYGLSAIDQAAPGGDASYPGNEYCTVAGVTRPCYVFDFVYSNGPCYAAGCYFYWAAGTSMAAPHVSGVAALIIGKNGGSMNPAQVQAIIAASSDDLGKPGKDAFYGAGRVNACNAVK